MLGSAYSRYVSLVQRISQKPGSEEGGDVEGEESASDIDLAKSGTARHAYFGVKSCCSTWVLCQILELRHYSEPHELVLGRY